MIVPVGGSRQQLVLVTKDADEIHSERLLDVVFVPLTRGAPRPPR
jgi:protein-L-isoaspartate O-methyltransferase